MSETVEFHGQTLYAPLIACRPVRPEDYPPTKLRFHQMAVAQLDGDLAIYPGSVFQDCESCGIEVAVGPRQQETIEMAKSTGLLAHVMCLLCAAITASQYDDDEVSLRSAGNPFKRA